MAAMTTETRLGLAAATFSDRLTHSTLDMPLLLLRCVFFMVLGVFEKFFYGKFINAV